MSTSDKGMNSAGETNSPTSVEPRRVAVIGVHGVAHHDPGETANAMADLLLSLPPFDPTAAEKSCEGRKQRAFEHFDSHGLHVQLQPVCIHNEERIDPAPIKWFRWLKWWLRLQEGSYKFARSQRGGTGRDCGQVGRQWSIKLLQDYYGAADSNQYITTRLEGTRTSDSTEVHIYEMFWADLARPTNSLLSFFLALFQLVLHIPSLSRLAIDSRPKPDRVWQVFQAFHRYASRMLQLALPLAKLVLLIVLAAAVPAVRNATILTILAALICGIIFAIVCFLAMNHWRVPIFHTRTAWILPSLALAIAVGIGTYSLELIYPGTEIVVLSASLWIAGAALMWWALGAYQSTRPGILGLGWATYFIALTGFAMASMVGIKRGWGVSVSVQLASFWTAQWALLALRISWLVFALFAIISSALGAIAWRRAGSDEEKAKARAAVRTSRFALAMPAFLFVLFTSLIWAALFKIEDSIQSPFFGHDILWGQDNLPHEASRGLASYSESHFDLFPGVQRTERLVGTCPTSQTAGKGAIEDVCSPVTVEHADYLRGVLAWSVGGSAYIVVIVTLAGLLILVWWALPSVLTERFPPRRQFDWYVTHKTEPPRNSTNHESVWMGAWISRGLDSIAVVTWLAWISIFLLPLAFMYMGSAGKFDLFRLSSEKAMALVVCYLIYVAGTTALLASLVHYSSPVLRVILDVDTYLRTGPIEATPRAKIFERYVSLLRHIAKYQGADGRGYDQVVIVAHSLGALISGDLLNLLNRKPTEERKINDPDLRRFGFARAAGTAPELPIRLFTMGNPLRQLLNRFFPYLYDWVRERPDNGLSPLPGPTTTPPNSFPAPPSSLLPDPADLGIEKWVSAYRSGDYVGRSLWLDEWYKRTTTCSENGIYPEPIYKVEAGNRIEFCIGAGAHTHYWDDTAPDIAEALNDLI